MADDLVFYTNPNSRGRIVRWMLEEVGAPYRAEIVLYDDIKKPAFLAVNPMGKLPALSHDGTVVTECAAMIAYLADAFPDAGLAPPPAERGAYYRWLFFAAGPLEAAIVDRAQGHTPAPDKQRMVGYGTYDQTMDVLEKAVTRTPFVAGNSFTAADVYVCSQINFGLMFGTMPERDAFKTYALRVTGRPACQRAKTLDDQDMAEVESA